MNKKITIKSVKGIFKKTIEPNYDTSGSILDLDGSDNMIWDIRQSPVARVTVNSDLSDLRIVGQKEGDVLVLYVNTVLGGDLTFSRYNNVRYAVDQTFTLDQGHYIISMLYINRKFNANIMQYQSVFTVNVYIIDNATGLPLEGVTIDLSIDGGETLYSAETGANGIATFYDLPSGDQGDYIAYDAALSKEGYDDGTTIIAPYGYGDPITIPLQMYETEGE